MTPRVEGMLRERLRACDGFNPKARIWPANTKLVINGADPATVRDILGHESIVTTNRYFNTPQSRLFDAARLAFGDPAQRNVVAFGESEPLSLPEAAAQKSVTKSVAKSSGFQRFSAEIRPLPAPLQNR